MSETKNANPLLERIRRKEVGAKIQCKSDTGENLEFPVRMV